VRRSLVLFIVLFASAPAAAATIGSSVRGRPIRVVRVGAADAPRKVLVVGAIHGNEPAGIAVTRALRSAQPLMRRYARIAHMRAEHYRQIPGGVARWENHVLPTASAFVVELAAGALPRWRVRANVRAVLAVAAAVAPQP
jgi:Zinc carboxypeptidase